MNESLKTYDRLTEVLETLTRHDRLLMDLGHSRDSSARKDIAAARAHVMSVIRGEK